MIRDGLKPLRQKKWYEKQDFSHKLTFGSLDLSQLPEEYLLVSNILNQGFSFKCTAYASNAIQESQHGISFDPEWFFFQEGQVNGEISDTGYDLRTCCETGVKRGFKPMDGNDPNPYKESSYFRIDNPFSSTDLFDEIRIGMYLAREEKKCVITGVGWRDTWFSADGIIPINGGNITSGHCIKIAGWTKINGIEYLVVQNSYGSGFGKNGLNYFPREVVNRDFTYGSFLWRTQNEQVQTMSRLVALLIQLRDLYIQLLKLCGIY